MTSLLNEALRPFAKLGGSLLDRVSNGFGPPRSRASQGVGEDPGSAAFQAVGGDVGVLLVHGFTGTPQAMRPWAEHLYQAGYTVSLPRLPGHGTDWRELNQTTWTDWYSCVEAAFSELQQTCQQVFVAGLSMGGALSLRLAQQHGDEIAGLILVNPAIKVANPLLKLLPVLRRITPAFPAIAGDIADPTVKESSYNRNPLHAMHSQTKLWTDVVSHLDRVTQPLLVFRSELDHVVDENSVILIADRVASTDTEFRTLTRSYHVATLDYEAQLIFDSSVTFIQRLST